MAAVARADDPASHQRIEQVRPAAPVDRGKPPGGIPELVHEACRRSAVPARPQALGPAGIAGGGQPLGRGDVGPGELVHTGSSAAGDEVVEGRQRVGDTVEPCRKIAVAAQRPLQPLRAGFGPGAPQYGAFEPANAGAEGPGLHAAGGKGMLQKGKEGNRRPPDSDRPGEQQQERSGRGERERGAAGIVDLHVPAPEFRRDPARESAVGGYESRRPARRFQRLAEQQRDGRRLFPGARAVDPADAVDGGGPRGIVERRRVRARGTHGGGQQASPGRWRRIRARPERDLRGLYVELVEDELEAVLGMARVERVPDRRVRFALEPGKDDRAPRQPGHRRHQIARRRHAARRTGEDHPAFGRDAPPGLDARLDQLVAPLGGTDRALLFEYRGPGIGDDAEKFERGPPVSGQGLGDQLGEPIETQPLGLDLIEQARELRGEARDAGGVVRAGCALARADRFGKQELAAERRYRGRQVERRRSGDVVGVELLVEPDVADREDGRQEERRVGARAQHRIAQRPARPPIGQQHRRAGGVALRLLGQKPAGKGVEKGDPGGDREEAPRPGPPARHPTWKS